MYNQKHDNVHNSSSVWHTLTPGGVFARLGIYEHTRRACDAPVKSRWPRVSGGRGSCVEQSAGRCHIQETAEDGTVCPELSIALVASVTLLFTASMSFPFCLFLFCKVS